MCIGEWLHLNDNDSTFQIRNTDEFIISFRRKQRTEFIKARVILSFALKQRSALAFTTPCCNASVASGVSFAFNNSVKGGLHTT